MKISWKIILDGNKPVIKRFVDGVVRDTSSDFPSVPYARRDMERRWKSAVKRYENEGVLENKGIDAWEGWVEVNKQWMKTISVKVTQDTAGAIDEFCQKFHRDRAKVLRGVIGVIYFPYELDAAINMADTAGVELGEWIGDFLKRGMKDGHVPISVPLRPQTFHKLLQLQDEMGEDTIEEAISKILDGVVVVNGADYL